MIAGILGLLILTVGLAARQQVSMARTLVSRTEGDLAAQSAEARLVYALLTQPWTVAGAAAAGLPGAVGSAAMDPFAAHWNFSGRPFQADDVTFVIQDENGRMVVPLFGSSDFERLLVELGVDTARARRLGQQLMTMQATGLPDGRSKAGLDSLAMGLKPRFPVQRAGELRALPDMDDELFARLEPLLTVYPTPGLNPLTAAPEVLASRLSGSQRGPIMEARALGQLDARALSRLAGVEADETTMLAPGPALTISVTTVKSDVTVRRSGLLVLYPYRDEAVIVWSRSTPTEPGSR
jgi:hypothetical protein